MKLNLSIISILSLVNGINGFAGMSQNSHDSSVSRRESFAKVATIIGGVSAGLATSFPGAANATPGEETARITTRMGGNLERFQDTNRGVSILAPSGWNKFDGEVGAYDIKWQDLVDKNENVKISSTPVKSTTTSISALGEDVQKIGENLAATRNAKLIKSEERLTDGILFYVFEFAINDGTHQLLSLSVHKGRIWSLDVSTSEKRWPKRQELYYNVVGSFVPRLT